MNRDNSARKIILVEDSKTSAAQWRSKLQNSKTVVEHLPTAEDCIELLTKRNGINLIISDHFLGDGLNGEDLCLHLKNLHDEGMLKKKYHKMFILMSSDGSIGDSARKIGITFIKKPETDEEWRNIIQTVEHKLQQTETILSVKEVEKRMDQVVEQVDKLDKKVDKMCVSLDVFMNAQEKHGKKIEEKINSVVEDHKNLYCKVNENGECIANCKNSDDYVEKEVSVLENKTEKIEKEIVQIQNLRGLDWVRQFMTDVSEDILFKFFYKSMFICILIGIMISASNINISGLLKLYNKPSEIVMKQAEAKKIENKEKEELIKQIDDIEKTVKERNKLEIKIRD